MADIAINPVSRRVQFTGNTGTGPFAFTFNILADEDIVVYKNTTLLTLTTDYTVATNADGTGSVTLVSALIASDVLTIIGGRELERTTDFVTAGDLLAASLNEQLDSIVIMAQQLDEKLTRAVKVNPGDVFTDLELPGKDTRKGTVLGFNATSGDPEAGPEIADVGTLAAITADISTLADIEDGTDATDAIQTVAGISSDVTTVSGISANVTTVAGISSDVTAVAADATDIGTVATNIASVNTVATNIADVITVANDLNEAVSEVVTVADDLNEAVSEIDTVAASISNVDAVGTNIANVNTVAGISSNVTTVAGISSDTTTVAGISGNVTTVAGISSDVTTVAADAADIGTVSGISANVSTVAGISSSVSTLALISANVTTVAGISANVTTVAGDTANIATIATNLNGTDTIGTVAGSISNVNSVGGAISDVSTVASNLTDVQAFANTYRIGATDPTTSLDEGDLFYNTTSNTLKVYTGSAWEQGVTAGSGFLPLTGGGLTGNLTFGDSDKAIFGAGSDLQIYHDGSHSYIKDVGTGNFELSSNGDGFYFRDGSSNYLLTLSNGSAAQLYHNGSAKLATTSTGVDITGTLTSDGLTVDGASSIRHSDATTNISLTPTSTGGVVNVRDSSGDSQIVLDARTTQVGIGTSSPASQLHLEQETSNTTTRSDQVRVVAKSSGTTGVGFGANILFTGERTNGTLQAMGRIGFGASTNTSTNLSSDFIVETASSGTPSEAMRISSDGSVGIGTSSPSNKLHVQSSGSGTVALFGDSLANNTLAVTRTTTNPAYVALTATSNIGGLIAGTALTLNTSAADGTSVTERMRIKDSGNVGINESSPDSKLHVSNNQSATPIATIENTASHEATIRFKSAHSADSDFRVGASISASNNFEIYSVNAAAARLVINSSGNCGIGTTSPSDKLSVNGDVSATNFNTTSDVTLKTNVETLTGSLDAVKAMRGVSYDWIENGNSEVGVIAQEVEEVIPDVVSTNDQGIKSVKYGNLVGVLIEAIKEQQAQIDELKARLGD